MAEDVIGAPSMYEAPAEGGQVDACRELAKLLEKDRGGPAARERARELYERAAELGADPYSRRRLVKAFGLEWYAPGKGG